MGRDCRPVISQFTAGAPALIDSLGKNKRYINQAYINQPGGGHWISNAGVLATPSINQIMHRGHPAMTPRTNALYAGDERHFNNSGVDRNLNHPSNVEEEENPISMAEKFSSVPVYQLA